jgi:hypothetical protein
VAQAEVNIDQLRIDAEPEEGANFHVTGSRFRQLSAMRSSSVIGFASSAPVAITKFFLQLANSQTDCESYDHFYGPIYETRISHASSGISALFAQLGLFTHRLKVHGTFVAAKLTVFIELDFAKVQRDGNAGIILIPRSAALEI